MPTVFAVAGAAPAERTPRASGTPLPPHTAPSQKIAIVCANCDNTNGPCIQIQSVTKTFQHTGCDKDIAHTPPLDEFPSRFARPWGGRVQTPSEVCVCVCVCFFFFLSTGKMSSTSSQQRRHVRFVCARARSLASEISRI